MAKRETILLRVEKGALVPADRLAEQRLRGRAYSIGDTLSASLRKARNPGYHRLAHSFGALIAENMEDFEGMTAHNVLKRLQLESGVGCDEVAIKVKGLGMMMHRVPRSLSFESMDEAEFREVFAGLCEYVARTYWPDLEPEQIARMAELMEDAA